MNSMSTRRCRCIRKPARAGSLAAGAALLGVLFGPAAMAGAAPSGPSSVDQVVHELKSQGYAVIVNRFGTGRSDDCTVSAVRTARPTHAPITAFLAEISPPRSPVRPCMST